MRKRSNIFYIYKHCSGKLTTRVHKMDSYYSEAVVKHPSGFVSLFVFLGHVVVSKCDK